MLRQRAPLLLRQFYLSRICRHNSTNLSSNNEQYVTSEAKQDAEPAAATAPHKRPQRAPLVKRFFTGIVDKELLAYPEVIPRDDMYNLQQEKTHLQKFYMELNQTENKSTDSELFTQLQQRRVFADNITTDYNGKGWNLSSSLMVAEAECENISAALSLLSHRVVIDVLQEFGSTLQKQNLLPQLAQGNIIGIDALFENNNAKDGFFDTSADFEPETNSWTLNGDKAFIMSASLLESSPQLLLVLAQTNRLQVHDNKSYGITAFLVDAATPGVSTRKQETIVSARGIQMRSVHFKQVSVPNSCVVGEPHDASVIADVLLRSSRLRSSIISFTAAKNALNAMTEVCINTYQSGVQLTEMESIKLHLSNAACKIYGIESLIYFTAGLYDEFHKQDIFLEAAITKYFSVSTLLEIAEYALQVFGPKILNADNDLADIFRNAIQLYTQNEAMDSLRLNIALAGLQYAGREMGDTVVKSRNPLFNPGHVFSKFLSSSNIDNPKPKLRLGDNVHPSLTPAAQCLEHSVARLHMTTELLLTRYGSTIVQRHGELARLAEIATIIYSIFTSVSRASRSYCIGLHLADHELLAASTLAMMGHDRVKILCEEIFNGDFLNGDNNLRRLSNQVLKSRGHFATHPLTYNF